LVLCGVRESRLICPIRFTEFLDLDRNDPLARRMSVDYKQAIQKLVRAGECRLVVNLDDLRDYDRSFCDG
jgi:DNA replication licensing factor MCM3